MSTTIVVVLIVVAVLAGTIITLRTTSRSGMPSKEVLDRATQRSRELDAREKAEKADHID